MRSKIRYYLLFILVLIFYSCTKDLNRTPKYSVTADKLYETEEGYRNALAKIYAGLALTGNNGPDGSGDLGGIDEGFSSYIRSYWNHQELPTDEAVLAWNDQTIRDYHSLAWTAADVFNRALYSRIMFQITLANAFIREASDEKLVERNFTGAEADAIRAYKNEARFLRALSYAHAIDLFGNVTFVTEEDEPGAFLPGQISRLELFNYVEEELRAVESLLPEPRTNEYPRADRAAAWMLLANLYLNAEVYTGTNRYNDAITYASRVIGAGYSLDADYRHLFGADNDSSPEFIFAVAFDGVRSRTWGGTTYLVHAPIGGDMRAGDFGVNNGWAGLRTTSALVRKFPDATANVDRRGLFVTDGQRMDINDVSDFRDGYSIRKWRNITRAGNVGSNLTWVDTDFPIFRLAEAYLIYAEAVLRGGTGGSRTDALSYINQLRARAYGNNTGNITDNQLTLDFVLDERARELYWEGKRRTDLVRYGVFTSDAYLWPWKGGVRDGTAAESFRNLYPIPSAEINTNTNLNQNAGY